MMQADTTLPPETRGQEGGIWQSVGRALQKALAGNDAGKLIIAGVRFFGIAAVYRRRPNIGV